MKRTILLSLLLGTWLCGCTDGDGLTANGGFCVFNDDCKSGFCDEDVCRARNGSGGSIVNGQACTSNEQCVSGNCYEGKICRTPNWGGTGGLEVGDVCSSDSQCKSKSCKSGFCAGTKTANGQACTSNDQCESGNCYEGKVCRTPNWGGDAKLEVGSVCTSNEKCVSGNCVSGVCNPAGVMDAKIANGQACSSNDQCATSNCYVGKVCRTPTWGGTAGKVGDGKACTMDDQCVSGNCYEGKICRAPNWGGTTKLDVGDPCTANDQCASNYCYNNTVCQVKSTPSPVSTSDANQKYCDAMLNECTYTSVYRNYNGCVESMDALRALYPSCTAEWDTSYVCISSQSCSNIRHYDTPLSNLSKYYTLSGWVPEACVSLVEKYVKCAGL